MELRQQAAAAQREFDDRVRADDADGALRHSEAEERVIRQLIELEPQDRTHDFMLGRVHYNRAHVLDSIGERSRALREASAAVSCYASIDGSQGRPEEVRSLLKACARADRAAAETLIGSTADARMRRALILARYRGRADAEAAICDAGDALAVYEKLVRHGRHTPRSELRRVRRQYDLVLVRMLDRDA